MTMTNTTLIAALAGIGVSGVVGPVSTAWATRRANRQQFDRDRAARRRDDLSAVVDEAARLLAVGATNLRLAGEAGAKGEPIPAEVNDWLGAVFPLQQRLLLRCAVDDPIVTSYEAVRQRLLAVSSFRPETLEYEDAVGVFECERDRFLDAARRRLAEPV